MPTSPAASVPTGPLLSVDGLKKHFPVSGGVLFGRSAEHLKAVDGISFTLDRGETLGVVGETGCGKSTTGRMLAGLLRPRPAG